MKRKISGWIKDSRDERDYLFKALPPVKIAEISNLSHLLPVVRNQYAQSACTGFGLGANITGMRKKPEWVSPRWIYYGGRLYGGYPEQDCGTEPRLCLNFIVSNGYLMESDWGYGSTFSTEPPSVTLYDKAKLNLIISYTRVVDGVDGICSALSEGKLVSIGSPWYEKWYYADVFGRLSRPNCMSKVVGGHEYLIYGHNLSTEYFAIMNSWGDTWAIEGKASLPFKAIDRFKKIGGYDAHTIEVAI
jgi:hypothetical protein